MTRSEVRKELFAEIEPSLQRRFGDAVHASAWLRGNAAGVAMSAGVQRAVAKAVKQLEEIEQEELRIVREFLLLDATTLPSAQYCSEPWDNTPDAWRVLRQMEETGETAYEASCGFIAPILLRAETEKWSIGVKICG